MACLSYNWEHQKVYMMEAIRSSHSPYWLYSCFQAGVLFQAKATVCRLSGLPWLYALPSWAFKGSWVRWCRYGLHKWLYLPCVPNPCSLCCRLPRTVSCCLQQREMLSLMSYRLPWTRRASWDCVARHRHSLASNGRCIPRPWVRWIQWPRTRPEQPILVRTSSLWYLLVFLLELTSIYGLISFLAWTTLVT